MSAAQELHGAKAGEPVAKLGEFDYRSGKRVEVWLIAYGRDRSVRLIEHHPRGTSHSMTVPCAKLGELLEALGKVNEHGQLRELIAEPTKPAAAAPSPTFARGPRHGSTVPR